MKQAISIFLTVCMLSASLTSCTATTRKQIRPLLSYDVPADAHI